jgi:uncharacterized protein YjeT (DUF2065 family)
MPDDLWAAFALVLIIEGILPFVAPGFWRTTFTRLTQLSDGQLRFIGLLSIAVGLIALFSDQLFS